MPIIEPRKGNREMKRIHENVSSGELGNRTNYRNRIDVLLNRVSLLTGVDKVLMTMYLRNGNSFYQMAILCGVDETTISRRIKRITKRLIDNDYLWCLGDSDIFTKSEMELARDYFIRGLSLRKTAAKRGLSYYMVRKHVERIKALSKRRQAERAEFVRA